ncbi:gastrula zinc finger protein XlCGF8.2DB-like [Pimephales promelas]|nr:gastrula zinc finger protein XlCGF8.2DB-like [Pimephales promelas]
MSCRSRHLQKSLQKAVMQRSRNDDLKIFLFVILQHFRWRHAPFLLGLQLPSKCTEEENVITLRCIFVCEGIRLKKGTECPNKQKKLPVKQLRSTLKQEDTEEQIDLLALKEESSKELEEKDHDFMTGKKSPPIKPSRKRAKKTGIKKNLSCQQCGKSFDQRERKAHAGGKEVKEVVSGSVFDDVVADRRYLQ